MRDHIELMAKLSRAYAEYAPRSAAGNERAKKVLVDGGSHTIRLTEPFPPRIAAARGAWLTDEDGHQILDYWQGHLGNILGHNPELVTAALIRALEDGYGLQAGFADDLQTETAELLCRQTGAEQARFTTSGTLATMYTILLARAYTGRKLVLKVGGGWHGAQPWALKGVGYHPEEDNGFQGVEGEGVPAGVTEKVIVTRFNDPERLCHDFQQVGDQLACFIVEPFLGGGGLVPASPEYLALARELTQQYGALLVFDEVISGFRFRAGDLGALYGLQPDLTTFGKVVGGGMPLAAVAGRADVLGLAGRAGGRRVKFAGGTYSAHPASLVAAKTLMSYLVENEDEVYPYLAEQGARTRHLLEAAFAAEGIHAGCTGQGNEVVPGSSMFLLHFPFSSEDELKGPEDWLDPEVCDVALAHQVCSLAFLLEDVSLSRGRGAVSAAHGDAELEFLARAAGRVARRIKQSL